MAAGRGRGAPGPMRKSLKAKAPPADANDTKKKGKQARVWEEAGPEKMDYSNDTPDSYEVDLIALSSQAVVTLTDLFCGAPGQR